MRKMLLFLLLSVTLFGCAASEEKTETPAAAPQANESLPTIWMQKPDGSKQCGFSKGILPEEVAKQLKSQGITVVQARKGNDGLMHAMVCGGATGDTVDVEVPVSESPKLRKLGFRAKE
jgi:hypothetical protein